MKIGFIFPNKDRRYRTIHLGIAYLAAYAREQHDNLEFKVLNTRIATNRETNKFFKEEFDVIGITVYSPVYFEVIAIFNKVRQIYPKAKIVLGGPYVTTMEEDILKETPADFAVYGEGEITFSEIISHIKGDMKIEDIDGVIYFNKRGEIVKNSPRKKIENLDSIPFPAYDIFDMDRYPLHRVATSRGCPFSCVWCNSSSVWGFSYRHRSVENVIEELKSLIDNYGKKIFVFTDNSFNVSLDWTNDFCDKLMEEKIDILWSVSFRADIINQETANKMRKSGCYNVSIGIESANNEMLKKINKATNIEKISEGIKILKNAGIEVMSQFVMGSPGETLDTIKESIEYAKTSGADYTNFYSVLPYRGTAQWNFVEEHGTFVTKDIHKFHSIEPRIVFVTPEFSYADRLEAIRLVKKEGFYSNQDKKNWMFDLAKEIGRKIQKTLPKSTGEKVYMVLKSIYRLKLVKKNNK